MQINNLVQMIFKDTFITDATVKELKFIIGDSNYPTKKSQLPSFIGLMSEYICADEFNLYKLILKASNIKELMYYVQIIFILEKVTLSEKEKLHDGLQDIIMISNLSNIVYLEKRDSSFIVLPAGESTLDKVLIAETIPVLQEPKYEVAYSSYISAMKDFMDVNNSNDTLKREIANNLRYSFERFLKVKFKQEKKNVTTIIDKDVKSFLEEKKVHANIINMYLSISKEFFFYANGTSKHGAEDISMEELEYLVYLMGSMVRLIHQLDQRPQLEITEESN